MTLQESLQKTAKHQYLIGKKVGDKKISHLVIIPSNRQNEGDIIGRILHDRETNDILANHTDFTIIVLFDLFDATVTGFVHKRDLDLVLEDISEQHGQRQQ